MLRALSGWKRCYPMVAELRQRRSPNAFPAPWRGILDGYPSPVARRTSSALSEPPVFTGFRMLSGGAETLSEETPTPSTRTYSSLPMSSSVSGDKIRVFFEVHTYVSYSFSLFVDPKATVNTLKTMAQNKACICSPDMFVYIKCNKLPEHDDCTLEEECDVKVIKNKAPRKLPYFYCNKLLEDDTSTVDECGIKHKDRILVLQRQSIILYLYNDSGAHAPCVLTMARSFDTVGTLKKKINKELGIPVEKQRLEMMNGSGTLVDDESLLLSYGITVQSESPTVGTLKKKMNKELGIPVEKQSLEMMDGSGMLVDDESLLLSYGITVQRESPDNIAIRVLS